MRDPRDTPAGGADGPGEGRVAPDEARLAAHLRTLKRIHLGVAHDLRAPLNAAFLNMELLRQALAPDAAPEFAERRSAWLGVVEKELGRLRHALEALLVEFAPGSGVQDRFDLRELLTHLGRLLAAQARQQRLALAVEVPEEPVTVVADRDAVRQALLHLAVDALERAADGSGVRLALQRNGDSALVRITGDGTGPARLDAVARTIVEEQGGHVGTHDEVGTAGGHAPGGHAPGGHAPGGPAHAGFTVVLPLARAQGLGATGR